MSRLHHIHSGTKKVVRNSVLFCTALLFFGSCAQYPGEDPNLLAVIFLPIPITPGNISGTAIEGGATSSFTMSLPEAPWSFVTIFIQPDSQFTTDPTSLSFDASNWGTPQTVTLTATDDFVIEGTHSGTISFASQSPDIRYNGTTISSLTGQIFDNDGASINITQSGGSTDVIENGATDSFTVVLPTYIDSNVVIQFDPDTQTDLGAGAGNPINLTFTSSNWNVAQTVTVTAVDDSVDEGNHTSAIAYSVTSGPSDYTSLAAGSLTANITDNDRGVVNIGSAGGVIYEQGTTSTTLSINLGYYPESNVTIQATPDGQIDLGAGAGNPVNLTFTGGVSCGSAPIWCANQTLTITAVDDGASEGVTHTGTISFSVTSGPAAYTALGPWSRNVTIVDNETVGVYFVQSSGSTSVTEGGATDSYTMQLTSDPGSNVTIKITPSNAQVDLGNGAGNAITKTFTSGACGAAPSWCATQTVTVTAVDDSIAEGTHYSTTGHAVTSGPAAYLALDLTGNNILTTIYDNEKRIFVTAGSWQGQNIGNISGADNKCATDANKPAGGTWKALLAEPNGPNRLASLSANAGDGQVSWVLRANTNYFRTDGTTLIFTTNAQKLFSFGNFSNAIGAGSVWTGLNSDWTAKTVTETCTSWNSATTTGGFGDASKTNGQSIQKGDASCSGPSYSLICVEQ